MGRKRKGGDVSPWCASIDGVLQWSFTMEFLLCTGIGKMGEFDAA
jgi:hypothetical protein